MGLTGAFRDILRYFVGGFLRWKTKKYNFTALKKQLYGGQDPMLNFYDPFSGIFGLLASVEAFYGSSVGLETV